MNRKITIVAGDGIGPEIMDEAIKTLQAVSDRFGHQFQLDQRPVGGTAYDRFGDCLPEATLESCKNADAVLLGAVGGPKWDSLPGTKRPEQALLGLRSNLGLFCNLRPAKVWGPLKDASPLRPEIIGDDLDLLVVRELTGGIYFGGHRRNVEGNLAEDVMAYSAAEVERIARMAFELAQKRRRHVTSIDKANILEVSRLWRETVIRIATEYPDVKLDHLYVDNAAMQLVRNPKQFDVILTGNMFGDILSDEASQITGSIGMLPSASLRSDGFGMYEPIHGSAPDIAGKGIANPLATILSVAMMLRMSFGLVQEADAVERAVAETLESGIRTADIARPGEIPATTAEMGSAVAARIA